MDAAPALMIACNGGPRIGFGHLMRARAIAETAVAGGTRCLLAGPSETYRTAQDAARFAGWHEYPDRLAQDGSPRTAFLMDLARAAGIRHVMLDDYTFSGREQAALRAAGLRVLHQYDASAPPFFAADLAVNASPAENASLHAGRLLRDDVRFLNGPRHAVLRTEFAGVEPRRPERPVERILVTFGGGDDRGGIAFAIRALAPALPEGIELVVMTGANNPNIPQIRDLVSKHGFDNINLQVAPPDVPALLVSCDLAVMAGGTSITEAAYCGLPMVLMAIAANQQGQCGGWERLGAARYLGPLETCPSERLSGSVLGLLDDWAARAEMARCGTGNVDLNGAARLLGALLQQD